MSLLGFAALALAGCYHDESSEYEGPRGGSCRGHGRGCEVGVSFVLTDLQDRLDRYSPVSIRACFDQSCDELTLIVSEDGRRCEGAPGGPPDQLTGCNFHKDGTVSVDILRVDDQNYFDGLPHTAAISLRDSSGERLFSQAETVSFEAVTCELTEIRLAQP